MRTAWRVLLSIAVGVGGIGLAPSTLVAQEAGDGDLSPLSSCIRDRRRLAVLMVVDQSGSLRDTDPAATRVVGLQAALAGLAELTGGEAASEIEVGIAGFDVGYEQVVPFTRLNHQTSGSLRGQVEAFASRDSGFDTDYVAALDAAHADLSDQVVAMDPDGERPVCRLMMLFTDGRFSIEDRLSDVQQERYGTSKPWAPDTDLTQAGAGERLVEQGRDLLCAPGGIVDRGRAGEIFSAVVGLETQLTEADQGFLRALAVGRSGPDECGSPGPEAARSGAYLPAADVNSLIAALFEAAIAQPPIPPGLPEYETCPLDETACARGSKELTLDAGLSRVNILALTGSSGVRVDLIGPDGGTITLDREPSDGRAEAATAALRWTWLSPTAVFLTAELPPGSQEWVGTWRVSFIDTTGSDAEAVNRMAVYVFGDLQADLVEPARLRKGEEGTFRVRLVGATGQPKPPEAFSAGSTISATIAAPGADPQEVELERQGDGTFVGRYTPDEDLTASTLDLRLEVEVQTSLGVSLPPVTTEHVIDLDNPAGFPQLVVEDGELRMSSIVGDAQAGGTITATADRHGAGCVWLSSINIASQPDDVDVVGVTAQDAEASGDCLEVPAEGEVPLAIAADPVGTGRGEVTGTLTFALRSDADGDVIEEVVPFRFSMSRPIDRVEQVGLILLLTALGIISPLAILYLVNLANRRFDVDDSIRSHRGLVRVSPSGVVPAGGGGRLVDGTRVRIFSVRGRTLIEHEDLRLRARLAGSPFGAVYGEVTRHGSCVASDRGVWRKGASSRVSLGLGGTWVFTTSPAALEAAVGDDWSVEGDLVCFFRAGEFDAQVERMEERIGEDLPTFVDELRTHVDQIVDITVTDPPDDGLPRDRPVEPTASMVLPGGEVEGSRWSSDPAGAPAPDEQPTRLISAPWSPDRRRRRRREGTDPVPDDVATHRPPPDPGFDMPE